MNFYIYSYCFREYTDIVLKNIFEKYKKSTTTENVLGGLKRSEPPFFTVPVVIPLWLYVNISIEFAFHEAIYSCGTRIYASIFLANDVILSVYKEH